MPADLRHIQAFLAVTQQGTFTRAASQLGMSQPTLTVQIQQFEAALGVRLFDRTNRRVVLTAAGRDLVAPFERLLIDYEAITLQARDMASHRRGVVTVATLPSIAADLLPRAIVALSQVHAGILVRVRDMTADAIISAVKAGDADVGLGSVMRADGALRTRPLLTDRLCAFVPAAHPLAGRRRVSFTTITRWPLVLTSRDSSVRQLIDRSAQERRLPMHVVQEATYMTTAMAMVAAGLGVGILPESALAGAPAGPRIVEIHSPILRRELVILSSRTRSLSPAAEKLIEAVLAEAAVRRRPRRSAGRRQPTSSSPSVDKAV